MENTNNPQTNGHSPIAAASPIDELAFGLLINRTLGGSDSRRPSDKSANEVQVDIVLGPVSYTHLTLPTKRIV